MLCSPESLSDTVLQWRVSCAKDGMKAMGETCEELGGMFKTSARIVPRSWRDRLVSLVRWIRGLGGVLLLFFGVPVPRLTFWVDTSSASPTGQQVVNHFQDPEEAERLGWGDCFPKGRIPGQRKLIYGFMMVHVEME